jgi:hypothetical protein
VARPKPERELENVGQDRPVLLNPRREGPSVVNVKFYCIIYLELAGGEPLKSMTGSQIGQKGSVSGLWIPQKGG